MKKVFNGSQLTHVWANQSQSEGRSGTMFFKDTEIYSYGYHYLAGKIYTVKGKKFALTNSKSYSVTTSSHMSMVRGALHGLMPSFSTSHVTDPKLACAEVTQAAKDGISASLKRLKVTNRDSINWEIGRIKDAFKEANEFRTILGKKPIKPSQKELNVVKKHLEFRLARYKELHTPEAIAKRQADIIKRAETKSAKLIEKFKSGGSVSHIDLPYELLRIRDNQVETSRGAQVPLPDAKRLFMAIINGMDVIGANVGHFTVNEVTELDNDKVVRIGCHKILLSEARNVLAYLPAMAG